MACDCPNKLLNLDAIKASYKEDAKGATRRIILCAGTGCMANGSMKLFHALEEQIKLAGLNVVVELHKENKPDNFIHLSKSGCQGFCQMGPLLSILPDGILYCKATVEDIPEIVAKTLVKGEVIERLLYVDPNTKQHCQSQKDIPFYKLQHRTVLGNCAILDPDDVREYISRDGYSAAYKVWTSMSDEETCKEILASGLRGRGGAGFPTGRKWEFARVQPGPKKYVVCNGDEGDPGAFMDRSVMEGDPHAVIEGMMIAGHAIGADEGWIYVRMEYPLAVTRVRKAIADAEAIGVLGDNVFGTGRSFHVNVMEGAGAFVCGEETALLASVEGKRGMPMPKPPFPAIKGLWGKPTVINNVETLAIIPMIILKGAAWYSAMGTETAAGTKTFALTGHVANTGLIEVPFGTTLREILVDIGGGLVDKKGHTKGIEDFKAIQIGGPSGGCLVKEHLDVPIDYDSLRKMGAMVGSGGLVAMNTDSCMVSVARFFMQFTQNESCGKCVPCREGTKAMLSLLDDIMEGRATEETLDLLEELAKAVQKGSLCALGKTAPNPVLSTLRYFRDEYLAHIRDKHCPTGQCKALAKPEILADRCIGCTMCARKCPVGAISGEPKKPHHIDINKCIKCGECARNCRFDAIIGVK
ncbi:MAG: NADH-quinone oxidoreductase subunit NuoF [Candidatus Sumerlaeales bacterium]|nr:NADH-quinone oxidoreductase subunit NuoF [Candidatus Sumerlaeales bacterium]